MSQAPLFDIEPEKDGLADHIRWLLGWKEQWEKRPGDHDDILAQKMVVNAAYAAQLAEARLVHPNYEPTPSWRTEQARRTNALFHAKHPHTRGRAAFAQKLYDKVHNTTQKRHVEDVLQSEPVMGDIWEYKKTNGIYRAKVVLATETDSALPYITVPVAAGKIEDLLPEAESTYLSRFGVPMRRFSGTPYRILHRGNL